MDEKILIVAIYGESETEMQVFLVLYCSYFFCVVFHVVKLMDFFFHFVFLPFFSVGLQFSLDAPMVGDHLCVVANATRTLYLFKDRRGPTLILVISDFPNPSSQVTRMPVCLYPVL